jgi:hypothetical protein
MPKPSILPQWATVGGAQIVEPTVGKKAQGWNTQEKPPGQYLNWWQNLVYQWMQYLNGLEGEVLTWTQNHTFNKVITLGAGLTGSLANALLARLTVAAALNATSPYTLLGEFGSVKVYIGAPDGTPSIVFVVNATFNTTWSRRRLDAGRPGCRLGRCFHRGRGHYLGLG